MRRLRFLLAVLWFGGAAGWAWIDRPGWAEPASPTQLRALEAALNSGADLSTLLELGPGLDPNLQELRRRALVRQFPDARWELREGPTLRNGRTSVLVSVTGSRGEGPTRTRLEASQQLILDSDAGRINSQTVVQEQAIVRRGESPLPVTLQIPDAVLTGQRYDVDVLFDEPLDGAMVAGGIAALTPQQVASMESPDLQLDNLGGGGLFKTVQAPFQPGFQTWAVLLVHPDGIVSTTKRVRVVSDQSELQL
ncbi:MAG: hypothetical protein VKK98_04995 [Cyanobacteriota bacterium]|nr:hypothetical protein [Cyanobacteriota bacterium]